MTDRGGYYDFKPEIESKEQLREFAGECDTKIVTQLERWWDKYKVSLHELDSQMADAETVMKGFLGELGYDVLDTQEPCSQGCEGAAK